MIEKLNNDVFFFGIFPATLMPLIWLIESMELLIVVSILILLLTPLTTVLYLKRNVKGGNPINKKAQIFSILLFYTITFSLIV